MQFNITITNKDSELLGQLTAWAPDIATLERAIEHIGTPLVEETGKVEIIEPHCYRQPRVLHDNDCSTECGECGCEADHDVHS